MKYDVQEDRFTEFWDFLHERQNIYHQKEVAQEEPPWTDDPILQNRHFCNIFRELDRTTEHYLDNYVDEGYDPDQVFFTTLMYRLFNSTETMDIVGIQDPHDFHPEELKREILNAESRGDIETMFSSAYMTTGALCNEGERKMSAYVREVFEYVANNLDRFWSSHFTDDFDPKSTPEQWNSELTEIPGLSDFIAYEVYTDMTYHDWFPWDENDFVNLGPGARRGTNRILGEDEIEKKHIDDYVDFMTWIRDVQDDYIRDDFKSDKELTLRTAEHSLCEFDKFRRAHEAREDGGAVRLRRYEAEQTSTSGFGEF